MRPRALAVPMAARTIHRALLACGVAGPLLFLAAFTIEGALRPGYSAYQHYVSTLSIGERGWVQIANFLANGTLLLLASLGWRRALAPGTASRGAPIVLAVTGVGFLLAGVFVTGPALGYPPDVAPGTKADPISSGGHLVGALVAYFGVAGTAFLYARRAHADGDARWRRISITAGVATLAFITASSAVAALQKRTVGRIADGALPGRAIFAAKHGSRRRRGVSNNPYAQVCPLSQHEGPPARPEPGGLPFARVAA